MFIFHKSEENKYRMIEDRIIDRIIELERTKIFDVNCDCDSHLKRAPSR